MKRVIREVLPTGGGKAPCQLLYIFPSSSGERESPYHFVHPGKLICEANNVSASDPIGQISRGGVLAGGGAIRT